MQPARKQKHKPRRVDISDGSIKPYYRYFQHAMEIWAKYYEYSKVPRSIGYKGMGLWNLIQSAAASRHKILRDYSFDEMDLITVAVKELSPNNNEVLRAEFGVKIEDVFRAPYVVAGKTQGERAEFLGRSLSTYERQWSEAREQIILAVKDDLKWDNLIACKA